MLTSGGWLVLMPGAWLIHSDLASAVYWQSALVAAVISAVALTLLA